MNDIQYSSRTRTGTDRFRRRQQLQGLIDAAIARIPAELHADPAIAALAGHACDKAMNVIHLTYPAKPWESHPKDAEFSATSMREHWAARLADARAALAEPH